MSLLEWCIKPLMRFVKAACGNCELTGFSQCLLITYFCDFQNILRQHVQFIWLKKHSCLFHWKIPEKNQEDGGPYMEQVMFVPPKAILNLRGNKEDRFAHQWQCLHTVLYICTSCNWVVTSYLSKGLRQTKRETTHANSCLLWLSIGLVAMKITNYTLNWMWPFAACLQIDHPYT